MTNKSTRGFAAMDPEKQRAIASKGGKAAHAKGTAHRFTTAEASEAGRKGGRAAHARGTAHRFTAEEASEAGRKGGSSRSTASRQHHGSDTGHGQRNEGSTSTGTSSTEEARHGMSNGNGSSRHAPDMPLSESTTPESEQTAFRRPVGTP
jgi:uncharacterized protein